MKATENSSLIVSVDVGSTTVKAVVVDRATREILWSDYQRHETRQAEKTLELLQAVEAEFPAIAAGQARIFVTGSGAGPLVQPLGARFVQEVNAVTLAVEALHPDVGSVVELGGQDAKIIIFKLDPATGRKQPICSMNDKCASGTGATIDKCLIKIGLGPVAASAVAFDAAKLHKVAAKCGVFAETDIVNLVKSGIRPEEILCSLADAIVQQNLSVLARGNTLRHKVLLLGGPNTYLPVLQDCWRVRIPETWRERGYDFPREAPLDEVVVLPANSQYYAAYGAAIYAIDEPEHLGRYAGSQRLAQHIESERSAGRKAGSGPPLVSTPAELERFIGDYSIPDFRPARLAAGQTVHGVIGLDGGSTSSKAVLLDAKGTVLFKAYRLSQGNPLQDMKDLLADLKRQVESQGARLEVIGFGATGYAGDIVEESVRSDVNIVETVAHMKSAVHFFDDVDVICDIGGQDIKVLFLAGGDIRDFRLSNQCSAGNGMLLQAMADQFGVPIENYAETAFRARQSPDFSYGCAVFLDGDRVNFQKEGYSRDELLAGLARVLPKNVWQYVVQIPRMAQLGTRFVLQGGTQRNLAAVKAQVDYISDRVPGAVVRVHPHSGEAGAIGAAIEALRVVGQRRKSTFIGLDAAIGLDYSTRNDESTRCRFCPNLCSRTFVDAAIPGGGTSRYISGFSCERGTVESKEVMQQLVLKRKELKARHVNLLEYEARVAFRTFYAPQPLPGAGSPLEDVAVRRTLWGGIRRKAIRRGFVRSNDAAARRRSSLRVGMPRVLNMYSTAPFFRTYFEALGIPPQNVCFSPATSEELFRDGAKYGSVDPCFPSKVAQAHIHHLLFQMHAPPKRPLDYIYFPTLTHVPNFLEHSQDSTACPIVAGTPNVLKAAFTREKHYFSERGIDYVDSAVNFSEPHYLKRQMYETWGVRLGITEDESDFAVDQGWQALDQFTRDLETRGLKILDEVEAENRVALLVLGRPYHADPGMNHGVLETFQSYGYPVLTIRSIPKDAGWLRRWFEADLASGRIASPLDIRDVWPENYSTNSAQKVWAAKFAARHPNVAVLDLSSFKCGHDAPTYGLIDSIIRASSTPYMALHDLDANKPAGSLKIRVKTYGYTLARYEEDLRKRAARMSELERRVAEKRRALLAERQALLSRALVGNDTASKERDEMETAFETYVGEDEKVYGIGAKELERQFPCEGPLYQSVADVAPLPRAADEAGDVANVSSLLPVLELVGAGGCAGGCGSRSGGCCK
ncbi:MAG: CoA activase [Planctomycetia bacterium]|nr:CoA activase [Planctomycetia bacterium]